jgi:hypothetical protein
MRRGKAMRRLAQALGRTQSWAILAGTAHRRGAAKGSGYARRLFMQQRHPSIDLIAHLQGASPGYGFASSDGRYQAALVGADTVIVDLHTQRMHRAPGVYPREFDDAPPPGTPAPALRVEGEETATAYMPTWTDVQWIGLAHADADANTDANADIAPTGFWQPWPDPRAVGLPPLQEQLPTEWRSDAPQATERTAKPASDWVAWLVALAVLLYFAAFGFQAMTWALRGGWNWLWLLVGPPLFGVFAVSAVRMVVERVRERRRICVALDNIALERGEGFCVGEPLALRLRATVAVAAKDDERTVPPERITVRLMRRSVRGEADGGWTLVDECRDEAIALREDERDGRLRYACELCAPLEAADDPSATTAQWWLALHDASAAPAAPFMVAALRLLPAR